MNRFTSIFKLLVLLYIVHFQNSYFHFSYLKITCEYETFPQPKYDLGELLADGLVLGLR
jgi:hypothetical protein